MDTVQTYLSPRSARRSAPLRESADRPISRAQTGSGFFFRGQLRGAAKGQRLPAAKKESRPHRGDVTRIYRTLRFQKPFCRPSSPTPLGAGLPTPPKPRTAGLHVRTSSLIHLLTCSQAHTGAAMQENARSCNVFYGSENAFICNRWHWSVVCCPSPLTTDH